MIAAPDPQRLAAAEQWAAVAAEHLLSWSNRDAARVLAFDVLLEFVEDRYDGARGQLDWALAFAAEPRELTPAEIRLGLAAERKARVAATGA